MPDRSDVFCYSIRKSDPVVDIEVRLVDDGPSGCIDQAGQILRMDAIIIIPQHQGFLLLLKAELMKEFIGDIDELFSTFIPGETACMVIVMLALGEISFAEPSISVRIPAGRHTIRQT